VFPDINPAPELIKTPQEELSVRKFLNNFECASCKKTFNRRDSMLRKKQTCFLVTQNNCLLICL